MAELLGVRKDNVGSWDTRTPPPYEVITFLMKNFHLNPYWLLLGDGEMYASTETVLQKTIHYGKDSTVVTTGVNNGHIVAEGGSNTNYNFQGGRGLRLCEFVTWWMANHEPDDQAWLEKQVERAVPEYAAWKREQ
jgi:hypothetical protein